MRSKIEPLISGIGSLATISVVMSSEVIYWAASFSSTLSVCVVLILAPLDSSTDDSVLAAEASCDALNPPIG